MKVEGEFAFARYEHPFGKEFHPFRMDYLESVLKAGTRWVINAGIHKKVDRVEVRSSELAKLIAGF